MKRAGRAYTRGPGRGTPPAPRGNLMNLAHRKIKKMRNETKPTLIEKIIELRKLMAGADIKFKRVNLRRIGVKRWSGYYSYLLQTVRREING